MGKASRASFGEKIIELAERNEDIIVMDADLSESTKTGALHRRATPRRTSHTTARYGRTYKPTR